MKSVEWTRIGGSLLMIVAISLLTSAETKQGSIRGAVVDERGTAVAHAKITTRDQDVRNGTIEVQTGVIPFVETDEQGRFLFDGLKLGHRYKVYASKEQDGYPDMMLGLYNPWDKAVIAKAERQDKAVDVKIQIGPKASRLKWDVRDSGTGSSINPAIGINRADTGDGFAGTALVEEGFLVPANTDLIIEVSEKGFHDWYYPGFAKKELAVPVRLKSGEEKVLDLQLMPE